MRHRRLALDALIAVLAVVGVTFVVIGGGQPAGRKRATAEAAVPQGPPAPSAPSPRPPSRVDARSTPTHDDIGAVPLGRSVPTHLEIPAIGVSTALLSLGLNADATIEVPPVTRGAPAGWYRNLAAPGEQGPAVILGHVDTARDGPAVFFRLRELRAGDTIVVRRQDGRAAVFTVDRVAEYPKAAFPTDDVYGALGHSALRLVTCGGDFDRFQREYRGNVIAYATLTSTV